MCIYLHHMLILELNMCYKLCDDTVTMMDDSINKVQHEETCCTCTSEKAITAEIILIYAQMSLLCLPQSLSQTLVLMELHWYV